MDELTITMLKTGTEHVFAGTGEVPLHYKIHNDTISVYVGDVVRTFDASDVESLRHNDHVLRFRKQSNG